MITTIVMEPGDVFVDADGLAWLAIYTGSSLSDKATLLYFTPGSKGMTPTAIKVWIDKQDRPHPEDDANSRIPISVLKKPFRLIAELGKYDADEV